MKRAIFSIIIPVAALSLALTAFAPAQSAEAQTATCPAGYTCTPIAPQPVNCPAGFICTPNTSGGSSSGGGGGGGGGVIIPPTPVTPTTNACYVWSTNLTIGSTGADVVALQTWLMGNGFDIPALSQGRSQRGYYGATTAAAVARYQASIGIPATGFLGALTRAALNGSCTTTNNGLSINLTSSPAPSLSGYAMAYKVTFDGSKYDPADITIELSCSPQYVSWTTTNGEKTNTCTNRSDNNAGIDMQRFGDGDYRSTITFFNTSSVPQLVGTVAKAWGGVDGKTLITTDKDAFNLPVSNITPPTSCPAGYTCVYTPGTPAQGNCPAGYICTPTTPVPVPYPVPTSSATVTVNGQPTLTLTYDSAQKESLLTATFNISLNGGTNGINISSSAGTFFDQNNNGAYVGSLNRSSLTPITPVATTVDNLGNKLFVIPAGQTVQFTHVITVNPKQLFAGTYYASEQAVTATVGTYSGNGLYLYFGPNKTNTKTIVGEVSPYINSVTPNIVSPGQKMSVSGVRFNDSTAFSMPTVYIDGNQISGVDGSKDGTLVFFVVPPLAGGYHSVQLKNANGASNQVSFQVQSAPTTYQSPVISGGTFPTTLSVGQQGTWTVNAYDPNNGSLSYSVNWGDTSSCPTGYTCAVPATTASAFTQSSTFTHSYSTAGTYTATFTVQNAAGLSAQTTSTVQVGNQSPTNGPISISSVSPASGYAATSVSSPGPTLTIYGSGFSQGDTVSLFITTPSGYNVSQKTATVTSVSPNQMTVSFPSFNSGNYSLQVSYAGQKSNTVPYAITLQNPPPASVSVIQSVASNYQAGDTYYNPRFYTAGWSGELDPANDAASATAWCKAVSGKSYTSGSFTSAPYSDEDVNKYDFNGSQWIRMPQGEYASYYTCSGGTPVNPVSTASASLSLDSSSPLTSTVQATNATTGSYLGLPVLVFDLNAQGKPLNLNGLSASFQSSGSGTLSAAYLYQGSTLIASASVTNIPGQVANFGKFASIAIPAGVNIPLTIKVDVSGVTGAGFTVSGSINPIAVSLGDSSGNSVIPSGSAQGNSITVVPGGQPQFSLVGTPTIVKQVTNTDQNGNATTSYTATFNVQVQAMGGSVTISHSQPSNGLPSFSFNVYNNGAGIALMPSANFETDTWSVPSGAIVGSDGTTFTVAPNQTVVVPVTLSFVVQNAGSSVYSVGVDSIIWSDASGVSHTQSFQGNSSWMTSSASIPGPNYASSMNQSSLTGAIWNAVNQYLNSQH